MRKELFLELRKIKSWSMSNKVLDVVLFGSAARGKSVPKDVDICILINDKDEKKSLDLVDSLGLVTDKFKNKFHVSIVQASDFIAGTGLSKILLLEGYSICRSKPFSEELGFKNVSLFVYTLKSFSKSRRVQFHYLLKGRGSSKGLLAEVGAKFISDGIIEINIEKEDLLREVFDQWEVKYSIRRGLLE